MGDRHVIVDVWRDSDIQWIGYVLIMSTSSDGVPVDSYNYLFPHSFLTRYFSLTWSPPISFSVVIPHSFFDGFPSSRKPSKCYGNVLSPIKVLLLPPRPQHSDVEV